MKALVKTKATEGIWLEDVAKPELISGHVLVRVHYTGICGTDIHIYKWDEWAQKTVPIGMTIGHEFVGEIGEIGDNVHGFHIGQMVSAEGHIICGRCRACLAGTRHLCRNTIGIGVNRDGAMAEYVSVPQENLWPTRPEIPTELYAIFDPYGNAAHTACSFDLLGEDVLITGAGPIGIMATAIAKHSGARKIVVTDVNEYRLDLARKMGATQAINVAHKSLDVVMKEEGMAEGFDVGLEMSGSPQAFAEMIRTARNGAKIAMLGILPKETQINWDQVVFKGLLLKGIYGREMYETWYKMTAMLQGGLDISPVLTHRFSYKDYHEAFELMKSGQSGKIILDWRSI